MKSKFSARARGIAWLCTLVYFASYLMRTNFAVMIAKICEDTGRTETALAVVLTGMTIFYGAGQVINGFLGDRIPPNRMLTFGLCLAAACNIGMFFCGNAPIPVMTAIWCVNGFAHAMLWPPIVRLLSTYLDDEEYSYAAVRVSWGSSFATIFLYLLCPVFLSFMSWRTIILCLAIIGIAIAVIWVLLFPRLFKLPQTVNKNKDAETAPQTKKSGVPLPAMVFIPTALIFLGIVLQGMLRDGVTTWMPSFLSDSFGFDTEDSILYTVILAVFSILSFSAANFLHHKLFKNEVNCAGVIFAIAVVCAGLLYFLQSFAVASILLMALIAAAMHGINLMLITVVPKRFLKSGRVSTFSGILNAGTYVGSAIATPAFAAIAEHFGSWSSTILVWLAISLAGALVCFVAVPMWKKFRKNYSDNPSV